MKFSADKAGKKAKCPKCGTIAVIEAEEAAPAAPETDGDIKLAPASQELGDEDIQLAPAPIVAASPEAEKKSDHSFDDDGPANYEAKVDPELEVRKKERETEEENKGKQKKVKKKLPTVGRKVKALGDAEAWYKVRTGLFFIHIGCWIWLASHLLQGSFVLLGSIEFPEYANLIAKNLEMRGGEEPLPPRGKFWDVDELGIYLEMIAGRDVYPFARFALTVSTVLFFLQALLWAAGYGFCLPIPRRYGMFGQVLGMLGLAVFNILCILCFRLMPVIGVHGYIIIPYVVPEITMTEYNIERTVPIHILWSAEPFWENLLTLFMKFFQYLEPTLGAVLLWSIGVMVKSSELERGGRALTNMSFGTLFTLLCFHLLSLCGGSSVLVNLLRILYTLWFFFLILFILRYAMMLLKCRAVLYEKLNPKFELQ